MAEKPEPEKPKETMPCPVCDLVVRVRRRVYDGDEEITITCKDGCGLYKYKSGYECTVETVGLLTVALDFNEPDLPGLRNLVSKLETYRDLRRKMVSETRALWRHRQARPILECLRTTENRPKIMEALFSFIDAHAAMFPVTYRDKSNSPLKDLH